MTAAVMQATIIDTVDALHQYCLTGELKDMSRVRKLIRALNESHPAAADALWCIAIRVQRSMMDESDD